MMATVPQFNGLYRLAVSDEWLEVDYANIASVKLDINQAHCRLGHIAHSAIKHAIMSGTILGIELDPILKPDFCKSCAKAKAVRLPFPEKSATRTDNYGE